MTTPSSVADKIAQYDAESFSTWMEKTNLVASEQGDLNEFSTNEALWNHLSENGYDLVKAINFVYDSSSNGLRRILIRSIGMS